MTTRRAITVVDLGFGDAGKGTTIDALARRTGSRLTVRFNGGPQAGHNVVLPDGRHHTFSQFASNMFVEGGRTLLARPMLIEPFAMHAEALHLHQSGVEDVFGRLTVHRDCRVITPPQQVANQLRELARGGGAHGTCGRGVGECVADDFSQPELTLRASDLAHRDTVRRLMTWHRDLKRDSLGAAMRPFASNPRTALAREVLDDDEWIENTVDTCEGLAHHLRLVDDKRACELLSREDTILFEGAQGVLLDEDVGFHPHTTWSRTTAANVDELLDQCGFDGERIRWGVTRCYQTRHGAGPLVGEYPPGTVIPVERHNESTGWQGAFRAGHFDAVLAEYSIRVAGPLDGVVVTHLDRARGLPPGVCVAYRFDSTQDVLTSIPTVDPADLEGRAALTATLLRARPVIDEVIRCDQFVDWFENRFGQRVVMRSFGPTFRDKVWSNDK